MAKRADIRIENHGSIYLLRSESRRAHEWLVEHTDQDAAQWFGEALVVEPRYVAAIVAGAINDGLEVR